MKTHDRDLAWYNEGVEQPFRLPVHNTKLKRLVVASRPPKLLSGNTSQLTGSACSDGKFYLRTGGSLAGT